jgi:hypothetical protein
MSKNTQDSDTNHKPIPPTPSSQTILPKIIDPKIDNSIRPLPYQLAGHFTFGQNKIPCIMLSLTGNTVLKLIQPPPKGQNEFIFYRHTKHFMDNYKDDPKNDETCKPSPKSQADSGHLTADKSKDLNFTTSMLDDLDLSEGTSYFYDNASTTNSIISEPQV